jgi:hypothetical protein
MASFTDQIMQFNPYVQQLPTEAMAKVGMYKQQKYEEGVQKIQSYIDNIAGLDVNKPIHKQYLQSKLNELGGKLKTVAAGDFSNFQLVNSVGGMATQIVKDPIIQNAVKSTQHARKEQENIQIAQKAGKSSVNNEDYYYDSYNQWLKDGKLDTPFTTEYIEHRDVDAKLRDLTSKLKEDEIGIENPYMRDDQGRTLYFYTDPKTKKTSVSTDPSKGEKKLDLDMLSIKVKGLPAERILSNFYNSLDANDIRQLRIDSWAHFRNAGSEYFKANIEQGYNNRKEIQSQQLVDLSVMLQNPKISGADKLKVEQKINEINNNINNRTLEKEMAEDLLELENPKNLEDFKYKVYTQTHLTNLAKDLSNRSYIQERKANPAEAANQARLRFQFDQLKEANDNEWKRKNYNLAVADLEYKKNKDAAEVIGKGYRVVPGDWKTGGEAPKLADLEKDLTTTAADYTAQRNQFAESLYPSNDARYKNMTPVQKQAAFDQLAGDYRKNPNMPLTPDQKEYLEQDRELSNNLTRVINGVSATRKFENDFKNKLLSERTKDASITVGGVTYTGGDITDFYANISKFSKAPQSTIGKVSGSQFGSVGVQRFEDDAALNFYKTYKGGKLLPLYKSYKKDRSLVSAPNSDETKLLNFAKQTSSIASAVNTETNAAVSKFIATNNPIYSVQRAAIDIADPKKAKDLNEFLAVKAAQFSEKGALDVAELKEYSPAATAKLMTEKGTSHVIEKNKDGSANVVLIGADGTRQIIPGKAEEIALYFSEVAVNSPFSGIKDDILFSPTRTTNAANQRFTPGSGTGAVNAKISGFQLPQLKGSGYESKVRFDVEGFEGNVGSPLLDKYAVIMYVPDPKTGGWKGEIISGENGGEYVSEFDVMKIFGTISPTSINQAIKTFK